MELLTAAVTILVFMVAASCGTVLFTMVCYKDGQGLRGNSRHRASSSKQRVASVTHEQILHLDEDIEKGEQPAKVKELDLMEIVAIAIIVIAFIIVVSALTVLITLMCFKGGVAAAADQERGRRLHHPQQKLRQTRAPATQTYHDVDGGGGPTNGNGMSGDATTSMAATAAAFTFLAAADNGGHGGGGGDGGGG